MSLANLSGAYEMMRFRMDMAEDQIKEFSERLAQFFLDDDPGAKEFLTWVAKMHRKEHPKVLKAESEPS